MSNKEIRCALIRGGTSKGAYFLAEDLPSNQEELFDLLIRIMGSPDERQIDGIGGAHPLTSKVAVVSKSPDEIADVNYHFYQVTPGKSIVSDNQTCGNLLAGVGPFAIERGLVKAQDGITKVKIRSVNPKPLIAEVEIQTPNGIVNYAGKEYISGVPFGSAPIAINYDGDNVKIFPTGNLMDLVDGVEITCVDAGMPVIVLRASDFEIQGNETIQELDSNSALREKIESIRLQAGPIMGLGDVKEKTVPKICLISEPFNGGSFSTRSFIPHVVHDAIGVLAAVSALAAVLTNGTNVYKSNLGTGPYKVEHPTGDFSVDAKLKHEGIETSLASSTLIRTARMLMDGVVWPRENN